MEMQQLRVISLTARVNNWLAYSQYPRILHVFDHVFNLINERGEVLSIVRRKIGNGPFNLVVEGRGLFSRALTVESPVSITGNQLRIGSLTVRTMGAEYWSPRPDWERLRELRDKIAGQLDALPDLDSETPGQFTYHFTSALARRDISGAKAAASRLAGLGAGLTPAGDDFLMGALYANWILHPPGQAELLAKAAADTAAPLTTSLSAAWLRAAGRGEAGASWHQYLEALAASNPDRVRVTMERILSIGATSGAEALAGFSRTFHSYRETTETHVLS